jgi:hypothetical protein
MLAIMPSALDHFHDIAAQPLTGSGSAVGYLFFTKADEHPTPKVHSDHRQKLRQAGSDD